MAFCYHCRQTLPWASRPPRDAECPGCSRDVKVCRNCRHFDPSAWQQCRETITEPVRDKEGRNFCDSFEFARGNPEADRGQNQAMDRARNDLNRLFGD